MRPVFVIFITVLLAIGLGLVLKDYTDPEFDRYLFSDFLPAFLPNLMAELVVGVGIVYALNWLIDRNRVANAKVMMEHETLPSGGSKLTYWITSTGNVAFRADELYWNIFFPEEFAPESVAGYEDNSDIRNKGDLLESEGAVYQHYGGLMKFPLFNAAHISLCEVILTAGANIPAKVYYYLSTPYGQIPKRAKLNDVGFVIVGTTALVERYPESRNE